MTGPGSISRFVQMQREKTTENLRKDLDAEAISIALRDIDRGIQALGSLMANGSGKRLGDAVTLLRLTEQKLILSNILDYIEWRQRPARDGKNER